MATRSRRRATGKNTITMKVDMTSVSEMLSGLKGDIHKAIRPAAFAGAEVMYRIVLGNVDALGKVTGNLHDSIYRVFSEERSKVAGDGYSVATYHVSWNAKKAPHGHLVEYGHLQKYKVYLGRDGKWYTNKKAPLATPKQVPAHPFIRPAFNRQDEAVAAAKARLLELLDAS